MLRPLVLKTFTVAGVVEAGDSDKTEEDVRGGYDVVVGVAVTPGAAGVGGG